ncbi:hypothetical protein I6A84_21635 [Frankia sp. CNm7]|uniref:Uncharacterized protein n=1 Tax=Frankia nepalensis TaxID=1836974 RepID=A0A937UMX8_9ACTN|nr:hypothetical protein [Frankia nepalensis]MBL7508754.1 hypothetical protein [Frankia nepalensis]MBL7520619.1 hypothetical protein [Frankia nepalensis]MBL7627508.1 hypothetical protein [Frankia nepalensis]
MAAVVIGGIGVDAARHVQNGAQWPLAALPLLLAGHTLVEAFVWWGLRGDVGDVVQTVATALYLGVAFVVLPVYVPVMVLVLEDAPMLRAVEIVTLVAGVLCAIWLAAALVTEPFTARPEGHHIVYHVHLPAGAVVIALYLVSTCGALIVSGQRFLRWFGVINLAAVALLAWIATDAVTSLWCAWAAVTSAAVAGYLRSAGPATSRGAPASAS